MSTFEVVAVTSLTSVATLILSRIRCILKPCSSEGDRYISVCSDQPLRKDEHEVDCSEYDLNGHTILLVTSKD